MGLPGPLVRFDQSTCPLLPLPERRRDSGDARRRMAAPFGKPRPSAGLGRRGGHFGGRLSSRDGGSRRRRASRRPVASVAKCVWGYGGFPSQLGVCAAPQDEVQSFGGVRRRGRTGTEERAALGGERAAASGPGEARFGPGAGRIWAPGGSGDAGAGKVRWQLRIGRGGGGAEVAVELTGEGEDGLFLFNCWQRGH